MGVVEKSISGSSEASTQNVGVIFGVTGLVGKELLKKLLLSKSNWKIYGIARRNHHPINSINNNNPNYKFISCDLLSQTETQHSLTSLLPLSDVTHVFWVTWASQFPLDSPQCSHQNRTMLSNALDAILPAAVSLRHFSLQTGTKHYVSLQAPFAGSSEVRFYHEGCPRAVTGFNFYYALEDLLREKLGGFNKVGWAIHRPGFIMGSSQRTVYNFMGSLCVYGSICKRLDLPFVFGGRRECWEEMYIDGSDSRVVAEQHIWAATDDRISRSTEGEAFNAINGSSFTWREIWPAIGLKFGVGSDKVVFMEDFVYSREVGGMKGVWKEIVEEEGLVRTEMEDLANWGFLDALFRCPVKMLGTREKADRMGFGSRCDTLDSILYWIDSMRNERLIP